jgi:adenylate cyclase
MECPNCRSVNAGRQTYCRQCGGALSLRCPRCDTPFLLSHKFCSQCGLKLSDAADPVSPAPADPEGERTHVTVLFSDICGYTALSDALDPEQVREISARIFGEVATIITGYRGFIEKFVTAYSAKEV